MAKSIITPKIIAPAGNLEKLAFAVRYGADAVYFGGAGFNLRMQADNFSTDDISEALAYCNTRGVKTVFLLNSFLHEDDIDRAKKYIDSIRSLPFSAIMVSDPGMLTLVRDSGTRAKIHLSTQMSTLNHLSVQFWEKAGVDRIVLAREATLSEIRKIRDCTNMEIEIFVHGALCISYSGRCLLSRYLSGRDANQGDCAHPCRWRYSLMEEKRPGSYMDIIEHTPAEGPHGKSPRGTEILSSKDLCLIEKLQEYSEAGVNAFKIEGRMKSLYYTANITRVYKHAVSLAGTDEFARFLPFWKEELDLVSHRPYTADLFHEFDARGFTELPYVKKALFLGYWVRAGSDERWAQVKTFNPIYKDEIIECIYPITGRVRDGKYQVTEIRNKENILQDMARPGEVNLIRFDREVYEHGIFRRRLDK